MPTENKRIHYDIECHHCKKHFPVIVEIDPTNPVKSSKELACPHCAEWVKVEFDHAVKAQGTLTRSFKPTQS